MSHNDLVVALTLGVPLLLMLLIVLWPERLDDEPQDGPGVRERNW